MHFSLVLFVVSGKGMRNLEFMGENLDVDPESLEKQSLNVSKTSLSLERSAISSSDSVNSSSTLSITALRLAPLAREGEGDRSEVTRALPNLHVLLQSYKGKVNHAVNLRIKI